MTKQPVHNEKLLIKNGTVWSKNGYAKKDVLFEGSTVTKIENNIEADTIRVFNAENMLVLPGLIDTHMHMKNVTIDLFGVDASAVCFPHGVTSAAEASACYGDDAFLDTFSVKNVVFVGGAYENNKFNHKKFDYKKYGKHAIGIKVFYDTEANYVSDIAPLEDTCAFASEKGLKVMVHSSNSPVSMMKIVETLNKGDILTHAFHGGKNNSSEDDFECLKYAKEKGIIVDVGFAGHVHADLSILKRAIDMDIYPDTIGTDVTRSSAFIRSGRYGMNYCMSILRTLGMPEEEIFKAATVNSAKALNKEGVWGELEIGSSDACVLSYVDAPFEITDKFSNTVKDTKSYHCNLTVVNGDAVFSK